MKLSILVLIAISSLFAGGLKKVENPVSPLDQYIQQATQGNPGTAPVATGSIWSPEARLTDLASDLRARSVNDIVTILVTDKASAAASGTTKAKRDSSANSGVTSIAGPVRATSAIANLLKLSTNTSIDGDGATNRETSFTTALAARVTHVLPNGFLVVEGAKTVMVNSENQLITVRGIVRPVDISTGNNVQSDRLGQLEIRMNGKGVVGDVVKRPFFLYRLLLGLLPF